MHIDLDSNAVPKMPENVSSSEDSVQSLEFPSSSEPASKSASLRRGSVDSRSNLPPSTLFGSQQQIGAFSPSPFLHRGEKSNSPAQQQNKSSSDSSKSSTMDRYCTPASKSGSLDRSYGSLLSAKSSKSNSLSRDANVEQMIYDQVKILQFL